MNKLLRIILCISLLSGCTMNNKVEDSMTEENEYTDSNSENNVQEDEQKRLYDMRTCKRDSNGFYYCKEKDEDGNFIVYREGYKVEKKKFDEGLVLYYDPECQECGYISIGSYSNDLNGETYVWDRANFQTYFYNKMTGELIDVLVGLVVALQINGEETNDWFALCDGKLFKLFDAYNKEWYKELCLDLPMAPSILEAYSLGNGKYFKAYKQDGNTIVNYILDYDGAVVIESENPILVGKRSDCFAKIVNGKYSLISNNGDELLSPEYDAIEIYKNGIVAIKDNKLFVYSNSLKPLIQGEYELAPHEYSTFLCCDNVNNFHAYDEGDSLIVITIDTDYYYDRQNKLLNPNYTHKFRIQGETFTPLEYDYQY